eukprot:21472_3
MLAEASPVSELPDSALLYELTHKLLTQAAYVKKKGDRVLVLEPTTALVQQGCQCHQRLLSLRRVVVSWCSNGEGLLRILQRARVYTSFLCIRLIHTYQ